MVSERRLKGSKQYYSFFGLSRFFGPVVFYLFGPLDSVYWTSSHVTYYLNTGRVNQSDFRCF